MAAPVKKKTHGEDYLSSVAPLELKLEDGQTMQFSMASELEIPDAPDDQVRALMKAPARLAFFAYQCERSLAKVRNLEIELTEAEGNADLVYRKWYDEHTDDEYTEPMIRSRVALDPKVKSVKINLNYARKVYGYLRALRESLNHRVYVLNGLVGHGPNANRG